MEHPNHSSQEGKNHKPTPLSKRFISRKIEEMLQNSPEKKSVQKNSDDKTIIERIKIFKKISKTILPQIRYPYLFLFGILIAAGWFFFFIQYFFSSNSLPISLQIEKFAEWQYHAPFISTPIITDIDGDGEPDIAFANSLGYLQAINPRNQVMIYQTYLGGAVIASLTVLEVDGKPPMEIFTTIENGKFFTINQEGNYLYPSREEYFSEPIYAKPLVLSDTGVFYLAGMAGRVWGVKSDYGELLWMNDNSTLAQQEEGIFSSPVLLPMHENAPSLSQYLSKNFDLSRLAEDLALIVAGEQGTVAAMNLSSGGLHWEIKLEDSFKASPSVIGTEKEKYLLLAGVRGGIWLLNRSGEVMSKVELNESFISSPVSGQFFFGEIQTLLIAENGNIYLVFLTDEDFSSSLSIRVEQIFSGNENFIASPLAVDWNQDSREDILAVSREGEIFLWTVDTDIPPGTTSRLKELISPYRLNHNVTATPVAGDLNQDGQIEIVIAGENGKLSILTLRTTPRIFLPKKMLSTQFLKNAFHER